MARQSDFFNILIYVKKQVACFNKNEMKKRILDLMKEEKLLNYQFVANPLLQTLPK